MRRRLTDSTEAARMTHAGSEIDRRDFLKAAGIGILGAVAAFGWPEFAAAARSADPYLAERHYGVYRAAARAMAAVPGTAVPVRTDARANEEIENRFSKWDDEEQRVVVTVLDWLENNSPGRPSLRDPDEGLKLLREWSFTRTERERAFEERLYAVARAAAEADHFRHGGAPSDKASMDRYLRSKSAAIRAEIERVHLERGEAPHTYRAGAIFPTYLPAPAGKPMDWPADPLGEVVLRRRFIASRVARLVAAPYYFYSNEAPL